jgi:small subunit ribosomal protein S17e
MIKRLSLELIEKYPYSFTSEFSENKEFLDEVELDTSKKMRNKIAGYISALIKSDMSYIEEERGESEVPPLD